MRYIITFVTSSLLTTFLISCDHKPEKTASYFGGEVINPNSNYVYLYKNENLVDSALLDETGRFLMELNDIEEGLYNFEHEPEYQYVFIEKGDSILIRLNTYDFDESLVFTGKGAEKNNFLIDMFLVGEDEENLIYDYYKLEVEGFNRKMDSMLTMKMKEYEDLITEYNLSENAKNIAKASIDYPHYMSMEIYPYMHKKRNNLDKIQALPDDFYAYREGLNTNDTRLSYFRPYFNYMIMKMNNLSYVYCNGTCEDETPVEKTYHYHEHKLRLIDSLVEDGYLRGNLYRNTAYSYLLEDHNLENNKAFIEKFNAFSENDKHTNEINKLYRSKQKLEPGKLLPSLYLINTEGNSIAIESVHNTTNRVFYFWTINQKNHIKHITKRVKLLQGRYPAYQFIGININSDQEKWLKYVKAFRMDPATQFRTKNYNELRDKLIIGNLNKLVITRPDGTIMDAFANIYNKDIEDFLCANSKIPELQPKLQ